MLKYVDIIMLDPGNVTEKGMVVWCMKSVRILYQMLQIESGEEDVVDDTLPVFKRDMVKGSLKFLSCFIVQVTMVTVSIHQLYTHQYRYHLFEVLYASKVSLEH